VGDDPYQWRGPVQAAQPTEPATAAAPAGAVEAVTPQAPEFVREPVIEEAEPLPANAALADEAWVELPAEPEPPPRSRRRRGKATAAPSVVEVDPEPAVELAATLEAAVVAPAAAPEPTPEPEPVPAPEPVPEPILVAAQPAPSQDENEILTPPATPKRGWWRRGA
jgi:ribonuclease E